MSVLIGAYWVAGPEDAMWLSADFCAMPIHQDFQPASLGAEHGTVAAIARLCIRNAMAASAGLRMRLGERRRLRRDDLALRGLSDHHLSDLGIGRSEIPGSLAQGRFSDTPWI